MTVYVDDAAIMHRGKRRSHLCADSVDELHAFAQCIGVARCWFEAARRHPHYDVTEAQRQAAIAAGAQCVSRKTLARRARALAAPAASAPRAAGDHK